MYLQKRFFYFLEGGYVTSTFYMGVCSFLSNDCTRHGCCFFNVLGGRRRYKIFLYILPPFGYLASSNKEGANNVFFQTECCWLIFTRLGSDDDNAEFLGFLFYPHSIYFSWLCLIFGKRLPVSKINYCACSRLSILLFRRTLLSGCRRKYRRLSFLSHYSIIHFTYVSF